MESIAINIHADFKSIHLQTNLTNMCRLHACIQRIYHCSGNAFSNSKKLKLDASSQNSRYFVHLLELLYCIHGNFIIAWTKNFVNTCYLCMIEFSPMSGTVCVWCCTLHYCDGTHAVVCHVCMYNIICLDVCMCTYLGLVLHSS